MKFSKHQKNLILYCLEQQQYEFNEKEIKDMNEIIKTLEIRENKKQ
tara:strand:+ start:479 stop:616 length:138 start_codon:yes stop_codon:yes gene_type:complete